MRQNIQNLLRNATLYIITLVLSLNLQITTAQASTIISDDMPLYSGDIAVLNDLIHANGLTQYAEQPLTLGIQVWEQGRLTFLLIDNSYLISQLPQSIGNLTELQSLFLSNQSISSLPESIGQLANLKKLHLDNNRLTILPSTIGNLSNLSSLYLQNNRLNNLPASISKLTNLNTLNVSGNPLDITAFDALPLEELTRFYQ